MKHNINDRYHTQIEREKSEKGRISLTKKISKTTLLLRSLVSVYVLYLAYELIRDFEIAQNKMVSLAAIILFVIGGGLILGTSAYKLAKGDYDDGSGEDETQEPQDIEESRPTDGDDEQGEDTDEDSP